MNNMSLVKITLGVAFATVATFLVNANEILPEVTEVKSAVVMETTASSPEKTFSQLLSQFDADNTGTLSESELSASGNEALKSAFKSLDANEDGSISEDEFSAYINTQLN